MFNALSAVKLVASTVVGIGTGKIVSGIIRNNVSAETLIDKVTILGASWVLGGMASKATKTYTDESIDEVAKAVTGVVENIKIAQKLGRINRKETTFEEEGLDQKDFFQDETTGKWRKRSEVVEDEIDVNPSEKKPANSEAS